MIQKMTVDDIVKEWLQAMQEAFQDVSRVPLKRGVKELLNFLHTNCPMILCYVATSNIKSVVEDALKRRGIAEFFEGILTSTDVERPKPDPVIYLEAARRGFNHIRSEVKPNQVLVIEDSYDCAKKAKSIGMQVCAVYDSYTYRSGDDAWKQFALEADYKVKQSFDEVLLPLQSCFLYAPVK